ncbi:MAG TPA: MFS transporter [Acidimicrobiales bacterium]|nr:MFS transporter [Acidimicrobiales bacterium]
MTLTPASAGLTSNKRAALIVLALADLMVVLDTTVVYVALPTIQRALHVSSTSNLQWVVTAYVLTFGGFLLLGGRVADRFGRRLAFVSGVVGFVAASLVCGLASSLGVLIAARAVQGLGAAFMAPAALSLVTVIFTEGDERNRAFGVWGAIASTGAAVGLVAGGALVSWLSWRWVFFVNVPIGVFAALASLYLIREVRDPVARGFDVAGAVSVTGGLAALVFGLVRANEWGWRSPATIGVFVAAVVLLGVFVVLQIRGSHPLVPPRLFRSRSLLGADVGMLLVGAGVFAMFFFLTLYMQQVLHYSAVRTGLGYLAVTATSITSATIGSRILTRVGARRILVTGFLMAATGLALLVRISPRTGYLDILPSLLLIGGGNGAAFVSMTSLAVAGVPREDTGVASALLNASQQVGGSLGIGLLTAVAAARFSAVRPSHPTPVTLAAATTSSWVWGFVVGAMLLLGAAVTAELLLRARPEPPPPEPKPVAALEGDAERSAATEPVAARPARPTPDLAPLPPPCLGSPLPVLPNVAGDS